MTAKMTLEQRRASHALAKIRQVVAGKPGKYRSYVAGLPATIVMNGLGQAAATLLAAADGKADAPHRMLYDHLQDWLVKEARVFAEPQGSLIDAIVKADQDIYVRAQGEALAYLVWLKKFAQAYLARTDA